MAGWWKRATTTGFLLAMLVGWVLIGLSSLEYFSTDTLAQFVIEKLPVRFEALWLKSLEVHVASALVTFPLCLALTTRALQKRRSLHRWLGRVTGILVIGALVPSGFVLAFEAKGGAAGTAGFLLSGAIVLVAMILGVAAARRHEARAHARAMRHVIAQMSVAVTSRAMLVVLDRFGIGPDVAYVASLWFPVLASAFIAEWLGGAGVRFSLSVPISASRSST